MSVCTNLTRMSKPLLLVRLDAIGRNTTWHDTYDKYSTGRRQQKDEKIIAVELKNANQELKLLRNKRLHELYASEWKQ